MSKPLDVSEIRNRVIEVRRVKFGSIANHPKNPKRHPENQRAAFRGAVRELGFVSVPLAYYNDGGALTWADGHLRGSEVADYEGEVAILDINDAEADKLLLYADPIAALAEQDAERLDALLREMQTGDEALQAMLAQMVEDAGLYQEPAKVHDAGPQVDRAEELRQLWGVQPGQLWALGEHRLICGDCTDKATVERVMGGERIDCITTDPPYGVDYDGGTTVREKLQGDESPNLYHPALACWRSSCNDHVALYLWYADGDQAVAQAVAQAGWQVRRNLIWNKNQAQYGALSRQYHQKHEPFLYCHLKGKSPYWAGDATEVTVWDIDRHAVNEFHPTQKPPELFGRAIRNSSKLGDVVFDGFAGSGTICIACESLGRKARMVEISPAYCAVILQRWADATNQTPHLLE